MPAYSPLPIFSMAGNYSTMVGIGRGGKPNAQNAASGGLPLGGENGAAMVWVTMLVLLIVFRIAWEASPMSKE